MTKWKVIVKPENGEPLMNMKFETEEDADGCIAGIRSNQAELFSKTTANLLIISKQAQFQDEWVEAFRDSIFRP